MTSTSTPHAMDAANPRPKLLAALRKPIEVFSDSSSASEEDDSDSGSNEPLFRARAQHQQSPAPDSEGEEEDSDGAGAYERMKERLAFAKSGKESQNAQRVQAEVIDPATLISSDEEDKAPVRSHTRRSITRREKTASPPASPSPSARSRQASAGLFVTPNASPAKSRRTATAGPDLDDTETHTPSNVDLQERVQRIRAERLARQKEDQASRTLRRRVSHESGSETDGENGRRLTQQAKPTRRAGKKALEAMARDQQRISRNMQLTHQSKTKKRFGVKDICSRWGVTALNVENPASESGLPTPDPSSALVSSDAEANSVHNSPPTTPPKSDRVDAKDVEDESMATSRSTSPARSDTSPPPPAKIDKGKGRAPEFQHLPPHPWMKKAEPMPFQSAQVEQKQTAGDRMIELSDSDDDLQSVQGKSRFPVFDRVPLNKQQQSSSLLHLRHLAHLTSPKISKKGTKSISLAEMQMSLAQKARQQALKEREEKIDELKRRGIHIATEEEREKDQQEIEDMVAQFEKQRQEDLKLAKAERKEAKDNGETIDGLPSSDEDDADYVESAEENVTEEHAEVEEEGAELVLSGSEEEEVEEELEDVESADEANGLINGLPLEKEEAETTTQEQHVEEDADMEDEGSDVYARRRANIRSRNRVIADEDDIDNEEASESSPTQQITQTDAMAAFGFGNANGGLGLTQMFAGTMANMDSESQTASVVNHEPEQDSLDFLRGLPDTQPLANFSQASDLMVSNSQSWMSPHKGSQMGEDSQFSLGISQLMKTSPAFSRTQLEDLPEPTQDAGFSFSRSPAGLMPPPPSTVDTVMLSIAESPIRQKKGKLQRGRREAAVELSDLEEVLIEADLEVDTSEDDIQRPPKPSRDAFAKMQKAAQKQKAIEEFNKNTSLAKTAVMEQAEESEDEYAGLGGASDDDSGEEDEATKNMIEHGEVDVDEREIAAYFADKAKKEDEKNINELYKNVMNGGLRRRAGGHNGFDMSDSEDEEDLRLRKRRAEFQKMNKALLADERIGNIAKDQKKQAFFHTLADFADEGEYEFLNPTDLGVGEAESQSQEVVDNAEAAEEVTTIPDSQTVDAASISAPINPLKRKSPDSQKENRAPPNLRRTAVTDNFSRKPITLADVQHSVSELLEDPHIMVPDSQYSDSESDNDSAASIQISRKPIVDRLSLSRQSSLSEAANTDNANLAFHAPSRSNTAPGFRVPSLIRQATSNLSATSESRRSSNASNPTETVRRGGTGKSNIHAQAREAERRILLEKKEGKRKEALRKKVSMGRKGGMRSVLGDLGGGFE